MSLESQVSSLVAEETDSQTVPLAPAEASVFALKQQALSLAASKGMGALIDQAIVSATSFLTVILIARGSSQENLGVYFLALSLFLFVRQIQERAITAPYMIVLHRRQDNAKGVLIGSVMVQMWSLAAMMSAGLLMAAAVMAKVSPQSEFAPMLWILAGVAPLLLMRDGVRAVSFAQLKVSHAIWVDLTVAVVQLTAIFLLVVWNLISTPYVFLVLGGATGLASLGWLWVHRRQLRFDRSHWKQDWLDSWDLGRWALLSRMIGESTMYVLPWLLFLAHGAGEAATLGACSSIIGIAYMFVNGVNNYLRPQASHAFEQGGAAALRRAFRGSVLLFSAVLLPLCLMFVVAGGTLLDLLYGSGYGQYAAIAALLCFNTLFSSLAVAAGNGIWALQQPRANIPADLAILVVTLALAGILVVPWGATGVAIAVLTGTAVGTATRIVIFFQLLQSFSMSANSNLEAAT